MDVVELVREFGLWGALVIALIAMFFGSLPAIVLYLRLHSQLATSKLNAEVEKLKIENEHERRDHDMQLKLQEAILEMNKRADERYEQLAKEDARKDKEITQLRQDNSRHAEMRAQFETLADERKEMIDTLLEDLRTTNNKLLKATHDLGEYKNLSQRLEDLHKSVETLQRELSKAKERNEELIAERAELKKQNALLEAEKQRLEEREKHLNQEIETLREQVTQLAMRVGQMEREQFDQSNAQEVKESELEAV